MKDIILVFVAFVIYPMSVNAEDGTHQAFDELPLMQKEVDAVTKIFWNAQSIQHKVKQSLPDKAKKRFTEADGCKVQAVTKSESSVDTCSLSDDSSKNAKFIYNFSVACQFGRYQVSVCSKETSKLMNQLKVIDPERLVSDDNIFDLDSTM